MKPTVFRGIRSFFLLYPLLISPTAEGIKACYGSDSIQYPEDAPCFPDSEVSFCCKVGWACIQGNMCIDPSAPDLVVRRASCTDPTFKSSSCPNFCSTSFNTGSLVRCNYIQAGTLACDTTDNCNANRFKLTDDGRGYITLKILTPEPKTQQVVVTPDAVTRTLTAEAPVVTVSQSVIVKTVTGRTSVVTLSPSESANDELSSGRRTVGSTGSSLIVEAGSTGPNPSSQTGSVDSGSQDGLSQPAKIGIGAGVTIGVLLIAAAAMFACSRIGRQRHVYRRDGTETYNTAR